MRIAKRLLILSVCGALSSPAFAQHAPKPLPDGERPIIPAAAALVPPARPPGPPPRTRFTAHEIYRTQKHLRRTGYLKAAPSSRWNATAIRALRAWQRAQGMTPTGRMDEKVWAFVSVEP